MIRLEFNQLGFALIVLLLVVILILSGVLDLNISLQRPRGRQHAAGGSNYYVPTPMYYTNPQMFAGSYQPFMDFAHPHDVWSYTDTRSGLPGAR